MIATNTVPTAGVAVACRGVTLIHAPRLIVCDEPTAALDAETGRTVMALLADIAVRPDRAVLVVTHDNCIFDFADRIAHMDDGRIVRIETPRKEAA